MVLSSFFPICLSSGGPGSDACFKPNAPLRAYMDAVWKQFAEDVELSTNGEVGLVDLTDRLRAVVSSSGIRNGQALLFTASSTSAITTLEFEPGLRKDLPAALERLFPEALRYHHEETWHDGNGHSHVRAAFLKPDLMVPIRDGEPLLGTWQQVVFVELDNKPRTRRIAVHVWGEGARPRPAAQPRGARGGTRL